MVRQGLGVALIPVSAGLNTTGVRMIDLGSDVFYRHIGAIARSEPVQDCLSPFMACLVAAARSDPSAHPWLS